MQNLHLLHSLTLFHDLLHLPVYKNLSALLADDGTDTVRFIDRYAEFVAELYRTTGYGASTPHTTSSFSKTIIPLAHPDPQKLADLYGYTREHEKIIANTTALLAGKPAVNILLYGDAGTGKSSTIKAIANEYRNKGLRLIEVKKSQLHLIPTLIEQLAENPLKFILFIDDLSFTENDSDFAALKTILEGGAAAAPEMSSQPRRRRRQHSCGDDARYSPCRTYRMAGEDCRMTDQRLPSSSHTRLSASSPALSETTPFLQPTSASTRSGQPSTVNEPNPDRF